MGMTGIGAAAAAAAGFIAGLAAWLFLRRFTQGNEGRIKSLADKLSKIEGLMEGDAASRKRRQDEIDRRLDAQYEYIKEAALQSGTAVVWTAGVPFLELLKAALLNIKLGANGNLRAKLVEAIMKEPNGIVTWKSFLSEYAAKHGPMGQHFKETIEWVEKRIA